MGQLSCLSPLRLLLLSLPSVYSFGWRIEANPVRPNVPPPPPLSMPSGVLQTKPSDLPTVYAVALNELKELEAQPLCHRVAARLLVNNCQLLDGKDEATVLTDSGRQLRDFIDSYAASLAICDLERGAFNIPYQCAKFREAALSKLTPQNEAYMHVTSREIDSCLSALALSDSAWNTWVSYRHKALRFCEAARVDNEKAQNVLLYQRLTKVIAKLTDGVEVELARRMADLDERARQAKERMEELNPHIDRLRDGLSNVEKYLANDVELAVEQSKNWIKHGMEHAATLEQMLAVLLKTAAERNSQVMTAHEQSIELVTQKVNNELATFVAVVASAAASSAMLQEQIEVSKFQAAELAAKQDSLERGLNRLVTASETLSTKHEHHAYFLRQASNMTEEILDTLEATASAASHISNSVLEQSVSSGWWPFFLCPAVSLVMGSYGLPPSILRNLALLAVGEAFGFLLSSYDEVKFALEAYASTHGMLGNATAVVATGMDV